MSMNDSQIQAGLALAKTVAAGFAAKQDAGDKPGKVLLAELVLELDARIKSTSAELDKLRKVLASAKAAPAPVAPPAAPVIPAAKPAAVVDVK